ncbi:MAG: radical SAM protein [Candidatus Margulisiibacteriota bacterium]
MISAKAFTIGGLWKRSIATTLARVLARAGANVVLSRENLRRGNILLEWRNPIVNEAIRLLGSDRELLIHTGRVEESTLESAIEDALEGKQLLAESLIDSGIFATHHFKSLLLVPPYGGRPDKMTAPSKGIYRLAFWLLRKALDVDAIIFNPNLAPVEELCRLAKERRFDVIGHSWLNPTMPHDIQLLLRLAKLSERSIRVVGGLAVSNMQAEDIFGALPADIIAFGAGEKILTALMGRIIHRPAEKDLGCFLGIPGIAIAGFPQTYRAISQSLQPDEFAQSAVGDVVNLPYSTRHYDLFHLGRNYWEQTNKARSEEGVYVPFNEIGARAIRIETSDYCRGKCVFCSIRSYQKVKMSDGRHAVVEMSPEQVVKLLKLAEQEHRFDSIHFDDDDLLHDQARAREIFEGIIESGLNIYPILIKARADEVSRDLLRIMKRAGVTIIAMGVEDLSDNLKRLGKGITAQEVEGTVRAVIEEGMIAGMNEIVFSHTSTPETIEESIERTVALLRRGNSYVGATPRMEAYFGAPILRYKGGSLIKYEELILPGMKQPLPLPTMVMFEDPRTQELLERAMLERDKYLEEVLSQPKYNSIFRHFPFPVMSLALFRGVYKVLDKEEAKIQEIEDLIDDFYHKAVTLTSLAVA